MGKPHGSLLQHSGKTKEDVQRELGITRSIFSMLVVRAGGTKLPFCSVAYGLSIQKGRAAPAGRAKLRLVRLTDMEPCLPAGRALPLALPCTNKIG